MRRLQYFIDVEDESGNKLGNGPITSAIYWRQEYAMDQAGEFETRIPLADPVAQYIDSENLLRCYVIIPGTGRVEVGSGVCDNIAYEPTRDGMTIRVKGLDELRYLRDRSVLFLALGGSGSPPTVSHATAISSIASYAPAGWTITADPSPPFDNLIFRFRGQSVLQALVEMAVWSKTHFYLSGSKTITFSSNFSASGVTCIDHPPQGHAQNDDIAFISKYSYIKETKDLFTRGYPYGGWYNGIFQDYFIPAVNEVNMGLSSGDPDYWPSPRYSGYTDNRTDNWLEKDSAKAIWGLRERQFQYQEIKITFFTGGYSNAIWRSLCRMMYGRAIAELDWYGVESEYYQLQLQNCNQILRPLQTVRTMINVIEDGRSVFRVDDNLLIIKSQIEVSGAGIRTTNLEVTNAERYRKTDPYTTVDFANLKFNDQYT